MKLSELTYCYLQSIGLEEVSMHTDCTDLLRYINCEFALKQAKDDLSEKYGDVKIIINPKNPWYSQIIIDDEKWREDNKKFEQEKQAWCDKYGCD